MTDRDIPVTALREAIVEMFGWTRRSEDSISRAEVLRFIDRLASSDDVAGSGERLPELPSYDYDPRMALPHRWFGVTHLGHPGEACYGSGQRAFEATPSTQAPREE